MKGLNAGASGLRDSNPHPIVESELMPTGQRAANLLEAATSEHRRFFGAALRQARRLTRRAHLPCPGSNVTRVVCRSEY